MTRLDFHIHSGLSACAENVMSPRQILRRAADAGLSFIAVTDHNASGNVGTLVRLSDEFHVKVVPGMEVATQDEVHLIALFQDCSQLEDFQALVDSRLPDEKNPESIFGYQLIYDADDEIVDTDDRLRQIGTSLDLEAVVSEVKGRGGFIIPSHYNREKFSIMSQIGFLDPAVPFDALEIQPRKWIRGKFAHGMRIEGFPVIVGSDAHFLEYIGKVCMEMPGSYEDIQGIIKAL